MSREKTSDNNDGLYSRLSMCMPEPCSPELMTLRNDLPCLARYFNRYLMLVTIKQHFNVYTVNWKNGWSKKLLIITKNKKIFQFKEVQNKPLEYLYSVHNNAYWWNKYRAFRGYCFENHNRGLRLWYVRQQRQRMQAVV